MTRSADSSFYVEQELTGRARRKDVPRSSLARLHQEPRNPKAVLEEQNSTRVAELVPLRTERMSASAFTFYRGTAAIMAADMAREPHSGILVASCGDAHVSNFGFYASPQRTLLFDLNDFDEAAWAPWEWDLKRLVTSIIIAGQSTSRDAEVTLRAARTAIEAYLQSTRSIARLDPLARFYAHFDPAASYKNLDKFSRRDLKAAVKDASKRTGRRATKRLTETDSAGRIRFRSAPPAMARPDPEIEAVVTEAVNRYISSANVDVRMLLHQYRLEDVARRAVGVGSVGTRCYITLLRDGGGSTLILQTKEAGRSVLEQYGRIAQPAVLNEAVAVGGQGARVIGLQRILQAYSDPFLGHIAGPAADYYVRQFHDMKGGIDMETLEDVPFSQYARACAVVLARAHGQSGLSAQISGYAGKGGKLTGSLLAWCVAYAQRARADYADFVG